MSAAAHGHGHGVPSVSDEEEIRRAKAKKQEKKMTKILSKAWSLDRAETFQEVSKDDIRISSTVGVGHDDSPSNSSPVDLSTIGQNLESGVYQLGRKGWETFAAELGLVYNQFIILNR